MSGLVLFVDDDDANLLVCEAIVGSEMELCTAPSAARALEVLESREVAVLVTDQRMPGMTGVELCEQSLRISPETIRILITAYSDLKAAIDAINRGQVRRYIRKPWQPEELLAELRDALAIRDTARQLRDAERRLREVERVYTLGVLAAAVGHELANPLAIVTASADVARGELEQLERELREPGAATPRLRSRVDALSSLVADLCLGANQMTTVLADMRQLFRSTTVPEEIRLRDVAEQALRLVPRGLREHADTRLVVKGEPRVAGSCPKLMQLVLNLVVNALQAFGARRPGNAVQIAIWSEEDHAVLEVRDNGPGIPAGLGDRVFEQFFTTTAEGGAGLGLAISRRIAEDHGGTLTAPPAATGACFRLELPPYRG